MMKATIEHSCPNCGASMKFDIDSQMVVCDYCGTQYEPRSILVDEEPVEADDTQIGLASNGGEEWTEEDIDSIEVYTCNACGSDIYTDRTTSATICPFCGNPVILQGRMQGSLRPDRVIPFKFDKEKALAALDRHYRKRHFVPKSFKESNELDEIKGLYVPYWVYSADIHANMSFTAVKERTLLPGKNGDLKERKYFCVKKEGNISYDHLPADASTKMPDDLMESLEPFDMSESDSFKTDYLSGYVADKYDVSQEDVLPRMRKRISKSIEEAFGKKVEGYNEFMLRGSEIDTVKSDVNYVLFPVWLFNLAWEGKRYTFAMNGQTGKVAGNIPVDEVKLNVFVIALFIFLISGAYFTFSMELKGEELMNFFVPTLFFWGIVCGTLRYHFISQLRSVESKENSDEYYREGSMEITDEDE